MKMRRPRKEGRVETDAMRMPRGRDGDWSDGSVSQRDTEHC